MKICFIGSMPRYNYSGGRLLALNFAEALSRSKENAVSFYTNSLTSMLDEFPADSRLSLRVSDNWGKRLRFEHKFDVVIIVPQLAAIETHFKMLQFAKRVSRKVVLLNFESPNWINEVSPFKRDESNWDGWKLIASEANAILSISAESDKFARIFYRNINPNLDYGYCYTCINSFAADSVTAPLVPSKRVIMLTRRDAHKGFASLDVFESSAFRGYEVCVAFGSGALTKLEENRITKSLSQYGVGFRPLGLIAGRAKFAILKDSKALFFPTRFEGFGIPPLEAGYCGVNVVCSDLPVLREFGEKAFYYADPDDLNSQRGQLLQALNGNAMAEEDVKRIKRIGKIEECTDRLSKLLKKFAFS